MFPRRRWTQLHKGPETLAALGQQGQGGPAPPPICKDAGQEPAGPGQIVIGARVCGFAAAAARASRGLRAVQRIAQLPVGKLLIDAIVLPLRIARDSRRPPRFKRAAVARVSHPREQLGFAEPCSRL